MKTPISKTILKEPSMTSNALYIIGISPQIEGIKTQLKLVADSSCCVLITGDNGTGKEMVARSLHSLSSRAEKPMVVLNCAAIPEELIESELFGHECGAFTGANRSRIGKFEAANGGTIFLDEIGDLSLRAQAKILRVLQEKSFDRLGGNTTIKVDVRVVAATNKNLTAMIQQKLFREDLFYRLNVVPINLPPLHERRDDIIVLAEHFLQEFCTINRSKYSGFTYKAEEVLLRHDWPGNVRELRNVIERIVILGQSDGSDDRLVSEAEIRKHLTDGSVHGVEPTGNDMRFRSSYRGMNLSQALRDFEKEYILSIINENNGNISTAASVMGLARSSLYRKLKELECDELCRVA
jgi:two-component system nitrogen regulation response regulator NtrX